MFCSDEGREKLSAEIRTKVTTTVQTKGQTICTLFEKKGPQPLFVTRWGGWEEAEGGVLNAAAWEINATEESSASCTMFFYVLHTPFRGKRGHHPPAVHGTSVF